MILDHLDIDARAFEVGALDYEHRIVFGIKSLYILDLIGTG